MGDNLIAIDTSLGTSVALSVGDTVRSATSDNPMAHAEVIGSLIAQLLGDISPKQITGVVVGVGPGPFTGLRVGIAAAQAFALGIGAPLYPVISHDAVALEAIERGADRVRVVQDAKRRELFVTEYERGTPFTRTADPRIVARADFAALPHDVQHDRVPAEYLIRAARETIRAGSTFAPAQALYLRAPDVKQPGPVKRVSS